MVEFTSDTVSKLFGNASFAHEGYAICGEPIAGFMNIDLKCILRIEVTFTTKEIAFNIYTTYI